MKLERKWARVAMLLIAATILSVFFPWLMYDVLKVQSSVWGIIGVSVSFVLLIAFFAVEFCYLRCTDCDKTCARPQWKHGEQLYCPKCGKPFVFDDEKDTSQK